MKNKDIRDAVKKAGLHLWQIAEQFGVNDGNFSRKLRNELSPEEKERIFAIVDRLTREKQEAV